MCVDMDLVLGNSRHWSTDRISRQYNIGLFISYCVDAVFVSKSIYDYQHCSKEKQFISFSFIQLYMFIQI